MGSIINSVLGSISRLPLKFTEQSKDLSMNSVLSLFRSIWATEASKYRIYTYLAKFTMK